MKKPPKGFMKEYLARTSDTPKEVIKFHKTYGTWYGNHSSKSQWFFSYWGIMFESHSKQWWKEFHRLFQDVNETNNRFIPKAGLEHLQVERSNSNCGSHNIVVDGTRKAFEDVKALLEGFGFVLELDVRAQERSEQNRDSKKHPMDDIILALLENS